jgi:hypothetical protein
MGYSVEFFRLREGNSVERAYAEHRADPAIPPGAVRPLPHDERQRIARAILATDPALRDTKSPDLIPDEEILLLSPASNPYNWLVSDWGCSLTWSEGKNSDKLGQVLTRTRPGVALLCRRESFSGFDPQIGRALAWPQDWDALQSGCGH